MSVAVTIDTARLRRRLAHDPAGPGARYAEGSAQRVAARTQQLSPVDTGRMRASVRVQGPRAGTTGLAWDVVVAVAYAQWIMRGYRRDPRVRGGIVYATAGPRPFPLEALRQVLG